MWANFFSFFLKLSLLFSLLIFNLFFFQKKMPCLIPEILFEIENFFIKNGNLKDVNKFGFSGKGSLNVLKNVFASVTSVEIYNNYIGIGWDKELYIFDVEEFPKCFLNCIGENVKSLYIEREINPIFQTIIDKIISKKQLKIPCRALDGEIINSLKIENLSILNCFIFSLSNIFIKFGKINSPCHASIQTLTFNDKTGTLYLVKEDFNYLFETFPSLKNVEFNMKYNGRIKRDLSALIKIINNARFSSNVVYTVLSNGRYLKDENTSNLAICKNICKNFIYDSSNLLFHCFLQYFKVANSHEICLKVLIPKKRNCFLKILFLLFSFFLNFVFVFYILFSSFFLNSFMLHIRNS